MTEPEQGSVFEQMGVNRGYDWLTTKVVLPSFDVFNDYKDALILLITKVLRQHNVTPELATALDSIGMITMITELAKVFYQVGYAKCLYNQEQNSQWNNQMEKM